MLYACYYSEVVYSLLLLQQLEVLSPYAAFNLLLFKSAYFIHCCKIPNKIDVVTIE